MSNQSKGTRVEHTIADEEYDWSTVVKFIQIGNILLDINNVRTVVVEKYFKKMPSGKYSIIVVTES